MQICRLTSKELAVRLLLLLQHAVLPRLFDLRGRQCKAPDRAAHILDSHLSNRLFRRKPMLPLSRYAATAPAKACRGASIHRLAQRHI
jgi:hypothetical protein